MPHYVKCSAHIRTRPLADGGQSLSLDIFTGGRRIREPLGMRLVPERTRDDREANRRTMAMAEAVRARRELDIRDGVESRPRREDTGLLAFFGGAAGSVPGRAARWRNCRAHLAEYTGGRDVPLREVTPQWVEGFRRHLDRAVTLTHRGGAEYRPRPLTKGTKGAYLGILKTCLAEAVAQGLIDRSPAAGTRGFGAAEPRRAYLTMDEVRAMAGTECRYPALKRAFLFSCLTGLRKSDTLALTWGEVERHGDLTRLVFRQKKTGAQEYLDISPEAEVYMGERGEDGDPVFKGFYFTSKMGEELRRWARDAGVNKPLTFHSGRHTFAVMMLDLGADIYTVQKLLGHRELKTTQIYADLLDRRKRDAVRLIPKMGG